MVSFRQISQALCLLTTISLGQAEEAQRPRNLGYAKLYTSNFVNHALLPRQSSCDPGYKLCSDGGCALSTDSCCSFGGSCHSGYYCYGTSQANGGCCPTGETCSGPGVGCTGTDVECLDGCHPAGYNCNSFPSSIPSVPSFTRTSPSVSTPSSFTTGCDSDEKTCGADYCIPSNGICCGDGYYCNPGHVCKSDGAGNYKCPLGSSSSPSSSFDFSSPTTSFVFSSPVTTSLHSGGDPSSFVNSFVNSLNQFTQTALNPSSTGLNVPRPNAASSVGTKVYSGILGFIMVMVGI